MPILEMAIATIVALLSLTVWWYFIFFKYKNYMKRFPIVPIQLPLLGATYKVRNTVDLYNVIKSYQNTLGKSVFTMVGPIPTLFTADPKIFAIILGSPKYINKPFLFKIGLKNFMGNSLILVNGNEWRHQRRLLSPALDYANIIQNINIFNVKSEDLINELKEEINNESTEVTHIFEYWALKQTYETILGDTGPEYIKTEIQQMIKLLTKITIEKMISPSTYFTATYVFTRIYWQERKALKILHHHIREIIERKKKEYCSGKTIDRKPIFIDIMMKLMMTDKTITEEFIINQLNLMITAAFDTSSISLSFLLYNLAKFPEIQQRAFEEVYSILGEDIHQPITNSQILQMKYLDLVIKESMRLNSTIPLFGRTLEEDVDYEGTILPKGLMIFMAPFIMHNDPDIYPEPEKFIPERFLPENLNSNRYSYTPFNAGVRNCVGKRYALISLQIVLAKLLLNYEFVDVHHKLCFSVEMTLRSKTGIRVGIRKRNQIQ